MSQSKKICQECGRLPGTAHHSHCSQSKRAVDNLRAAADRAMKPRVAWAFGPMVVQMDDGTRTLTFNPGIPFVGKDKPWNAGGVPRNAQQRTQAFLDSMKRTAEQMRAAAEQPVDDVCQCGEPFGAHSEVSNHSPVAMGMPTDEQLAEAAREAGLPAVTARDLLAEAEELVRGQG